MGWRRYRRRSWEERPQRPKAAKLSPEKRDAILAKLLKERDKSPVLEALAFDIKASRGRFYLNAPDPEEAGEVLDLGRITPLAGDRLTLLLEVRYKNWKEIARGGVAKVMKAIASDSKGRFHGLGILDAELREHGLERHKMRKRGEAFLYPDGREATVQQVLYHRFGLPIPVIAEPTDWYYFHREPAIVEQNLRRGRVLVQFSSADRRGNPFGSRCLYARRQGVWGCYVVRPSAGASIATAEAWLEKREWKSW